MLSCLGTVLKVRHTAPALRIRREEQGRGTESLHRDRGRGWVGSSCTPNAKLPRHRVLQCGTRHLRCGSDVTDREEGRNHCRPGDQEAAEGEPVSRERDSPEGEWVSRDRDSPEAEGVGRERRRCSSPSEGESHGRGDGKSGPSSLVTVTSFPSSRGLTCEKSAREHAVVIA